MFIVSVERVLPGSTTPGMYAVEGTFPEIVAKFKRYSNLCCDDPESANFRFRLKGFYETEGDYSDAPYADMGVLNLDVCIQDMLEQEAVRNASDWEEQEDR